MAPTRRPPWLWPSVAVGVLLLALFAAWALVVRVKTSNGVMELVDLPRDAEVFVDGEKVALTWPGGGKPAVISVTAGTHKVTVKKDGMEFSGAEMTVRAEGKAEFLVRFVPPADSPVAKGKADDRLPRSEEEGEIPWEEPPDLPLEATDIRGASGGAVDRPATGSAVKREISPAALPLKPTEKMSLPATPLVYIDEFNGPRNVFPRDPNTSRDPPHGRSDGVYFVDAPGGSFWGWNIHGIRSDGTCEVVARVLSEHPARTAACLVLVSSKSAPRGFLVKINVKGELFLNPSPWKQAAAFRQIDPRTGPIMHPAIKPGTAFNKLRLIIRKREVVIFVNGVQVCDPVRFNYDLTPAWLQFGAAGPGMKRAEFDRLEIRERMQPEVTPAKAKAIPSVAPATVKPADLPKPHLTVPDNLPKLITNSIGMKQVILPAGEFVMGSPGDDQDAGLPEKPQHIVRISPFYLGVTEVTQAQYEAVMGNNPSHFSSAGDGKEQVAGRSTAQYPVERISGLDAVRFCDALSEKEGRRPFYQESEREPVRTSKGSGYRLPTEAEWEYACRAGTRTRYSFGDGSTLRDHGWFKGNAGGGTHPVGEKNANGFGLYDMHGNVSEWCSDWFDEAYYKRSPANDPPGPSVGATVWSAVGPGVTDREACARRLVVPSHRTDGRSPGAFAWPWATLTVELRKPGTDAWR